MTNVSDLNGKKVIKTSNQICQELIKIYAGLYFDPKKLEIKKVLIEESKKFEEVLNKGLKLLKKCQPAQVNCQFAFNLFQTYGFPFALMTSPEVFVYRNLRLRT